MLTQTHATYLGPATVLEAAGDRIKLELPDEEVWAVCALAMPYRPVKGDVVLAIGHVGASYVIGVLKGSGQSLLSVPGDMEICAPRGRITITAARGIDLRSREVCVTANRLELCAKAVFERFVEATRWIKETYHLRSGRLRTRVDGVYDLGASRIVERAVRDVKIDGEKIHLG